MELSDLLGTVRRWWWLMLLSTIIAGSVSWWAVKDRPYLYKTSTTLLIGRALESVNPNYADFYTSDQLAQTYSELIKREVILREAAAALGFEEQWATLRGQIGVRLVAGTQLIEITVTDTNPQRAKLIADEVARQLQEKVTPEETADRRFIRLQAQTFPPKIEAAQVEIQRLEVELAASFSARQIQDLQTQINTLQGQINTWQSTYAQYQLLLEGSGAKVLEVVEEAPVPTVPIRSDQFSQVALAAAIGLALGAGAAVLLEYLDDTLKSPQEAFKATGLGTLGVITRIRGDTPAQRLVTVHHPKSPISEAYRTLRTNLQFSSLDQPLRSLLVTSPNPKEGKSTTLANLGVVIAQAGKSVILVDSDLRRPMLHKILDLPNKEGLTSLLLEEVPSPDGKLQHTGIEGLKVLTSGPLPPNPSELLGSQKMRRLVEELGQRADVLLFDSPPALPVTDAAVLASLADGVVMVTDAGQTRRGAARQAVQGLRQVGANLLGLAVNRLPLGGAGRYYYYYYYYYHYQYAQPARRPRLWRLRLRMRRRWVAWAAAAGVVLLLAALVTLGIWFGFLPI